MHFREEMPAADEVMDTVACKISWERIEAKRQSSSELCGAFIALCPNCGHPDCEGPGSDSDNSSTISYRSTHEFNF